MFSKSVAAVAVAGAMLVAPSVSNAGGEVQEYQRTTQTTLSSGAYGAPSAYSNYAPAPSYVRPMSAYYGSPYMGPCPTTPYGMAGMGGGYGYGCPSPCRPCGGGGAGGGLFGNPVFTAGLLGLGLGYLIWH